MMKGFPKHKRYKDSGLDWLGKIPMHWEVRRHFGLFDERKEVNHPDMELLSVTIERGVIKQNEITVKKDSSNEDKRKYKVVRKGDLAYNKMRMWQGAIGMSEHDGIVSPAYIILNPRDKAYSKFFHYLFRAASFIREANRYSYGLCDDMNSLRYEDFKTMYSPIPPKKGVERIVAFLDQKTAEIDETIEKKQRLIELLMEQKAVLINHAVTKGLDSNVSMRDSGMAWIGKIPAHWKTPPMYARFRIELGKMLDAKRITGKHLVKYLRNTDVQWGYINTENLPEMDILPLEKDRYLLKPGDLLVCEGGDIGRCAIWTLNNANIGFQKALHRVRPKDQTKESIKYLFYIMRCASINNAFFETAKPNTIAHLTGEMFKRYRFPQPPKKEQESIVKYIELVESKHNKLISNEQKMINYLNEYKGTLISKTVTGQIKI